MTKNDLIDLFTNALNLSQEYTVRETADTKRPFVIGYTIDDEFTVVDAAKSASDAEARAFKLEMESAAEAFIRQLSAAGLAIVPAEATAEMRSAGYDPCRYDEPGEQPDIGDIYREMVESGRIK